MMSEWRPIETAPGNAIQRLLWVPTPDLPRVRGYACIGSLDDHGNWFVDDDGVVTPSHWMPIPDEPKD